MTKKNTCLSFLTVMPLFVIPTLLTACAINPHVNLPHGSGTWTTGCQLSERETTSFAMQGFARLRIAKPCTQLITTSQYRGSGRKMVPAETKFNEILTGQVGNWTWRLLGTTAVTRAWSNEVQSGSDKSKARPYGPVVDWTSMFKTLYSVYAYVLDNAPPASKFRIKFFPASLSIKRRGLTPLGNPLARNLFLPFDVKQSPAQSNRTHGLSSMQQAYIYAFNTVCFEYMHELFFTKHLKSMNYFTQAAADKVTCLGAELLAMRGNPHFAMAFQPLTSSDVAAAKTSAKKNDDVDQWAFVVGTKNISRLLDVQKTAVTVHATDTATVLKILQLARAMLQDPVNLIYQSYPLKKVEKQPAYSTTAGG